MRVALFATCLIDALFPDAGKATVRLLERLGQPVEFPLEQTCCGQLHANSGYFEPALVRRYVTTFSDYDAVVVPSGSCAGAIRHQHAMIARDANDDALAAAARATADKTYELIDVLNTDDVGMSSPFVRLTASGANRWSPAAIPPTASRLSTNNDIGRG